MVIEGTREPLPSSIQNLLLDSENRILQTGFHKGSIITKLKDGQNSIVFSDTIDISEDLSKIDGLKVGVNGDLAIAEKGVFEISKSKILYSVKMDKEIVKTFDKARFNTSFPYITAFLHTSCLYNYSQKHPINHLDFVRGEILSHPVALLYHNSILVGDRAVIDDQGYPVFYNAFLIQRSESSQPEELISFTYEPIFRMNIHFIKWIIILGVEMLK
ncbi:MAG: hypothetical protein JW776_13880 [Candidatus Lokiarchaeota archaeon]|nr:hypothetical protein [Candidatus Lokiarchaeota archaeon]